MKIIALVLLYATFVHTEIKFCPTYCKCTVEGVSGVNALCLQLDLKDQQFHDSIQHLVIYNENNTQLSLSNNVFTKLGLQKLESIKIVNSSLTDISVNAFQGLTALFDVNLSDNQLFLIHADTFANNTNLRRLKLSGNPLQLTQLLQTPNDYLLRSSSLTDFDISNCQLSQILPKTFSQLKNLVFVTLASNYLRSIPKDVFEALEYLEELDLSNNLITKVEKNVFKMNKELSVLKLEKNPIELFSGINLPGLEELDLSYCKLKLLMKETVEGMPQLLQLNLSYNQIELISDDTFVDLTILKHLDLSYNRLTGPLPIDSLKNNRDLETLSLSGNKELGTFLEDSGFVGDHMAMLKLDIADCGLTKLTTGQFNGMNNLNVLNVSYNAIKTLNGSTFSSLKRLNQIDLSHNQLETLDLNLFASNSELVKLKLDGNQLKVLPLFTFSQTPNLKLLDVSNCKLERLWDTHKHDPEGHKILSNLVQLDVSHNRLKYLHVYDFTNMVHLQAIDISGNPLECIKPTIQLIEWFVTKQVDPYHQNEKLIPTGEEDRVKWNELIGVICPLKAINEVQSSVKKNKAAALNNILPGLENSQNSFTSVDEIVVEGGDSAIMWHVILIVSILIVALYFVIYLVGEITHRRRSMATVYARPGSLGGHVRTRGTAGSPLYYKLYEECSIPAQPTKPKKSYILDFSPIHTILKKGTYKIMKNNTQVNV